MMKLIFKEEHFSIPTAVFFKIRAASFPCFLALYCFSRSHPKSDHIQVWHSPSQAKSMAWICLFGYPTLNYGAWSILESSSLREQIKSYAAIRLPNLYSKYYRYLSSELVSVNPLPFSVLGQTNSYRNPLTMKVWRTFKKLFSHSCYQVLKGSCWRAKGWLMENICWSFNFPTFTILANMDIQISDKDHHWHASAWHVSFLVNPSSTMWWLIHSKMQWAYDPSICAKCSSLWGTLSFSRELF